MNILGAVVLTLMVVATLANIRQAALYQRHRKRLLEAQAELDGAAESADEAFATLIAQTVTIAEAHVRVRGIAKTILKIESEPGNNHLNSDDFITLSNIANMNCICGQPHDDGVEAPEAASTDQ